MTRHPGRFAVLALTVASAACGGGGGGGSSKTVAPEAKSAGSAAEQKMADSLETVQDVSDLRNAVQPQLDSIAGQVDGLAGSCTSNCSLTGVDLSGLPPPSSLSSSISTSTSGALARSAREAGLRAAVQGSGTSAVYGCLRPADPANPTLGAVWDAPGDNSCTSADNLDVTYANGDEVEYDWGWDSTGVWTKMWVVSGNWSGTYVDYSFDFDNVNNGWTITTTAHAVYQDWPNPKTIDRYINTRWDMESSDVDTSWTWTTSGDIVDLIALTKFTSNLTFKDEVQVSGSMGSLSWSGNAKWSDIEQPKSSLGPFTESGHVLEFSNMLLNESWSSSEMDFHYSVTGSGDVKYDGEVVGHLVTHSDNTYTVYIKWNDGTETEFDIFSIEISTWF